MKKRFGGGLIAWGIKAAFRCRCKLCLVEVDYGGSVSTGKLRTVIAACDRWEDHPGRCTGTNRDGLRLRW